jgi:hypothetical protein
MRIEHPFCAVALFAFLLLTFIPGSLLADSRVSPVAGFLQQYCLDCHSGPDSENAFDIAGIGRDLQKADTMAKWVRLFDRVERNEMPPKDVDQPSPSERQAFLAALDKVLSAASSVKASTVLRRLNRVEYENTLNDMFGLREPLADLLPEDGKTHGFDNVGETLDLSSVHLERYMTAAGKAIDASVRKFPTPEAKRTSHSLADGKNADRIGKLWHRTSDGAVVVFNNGSFPRPELESFRAPLEGNYRITINGYAYQSDRPVTADVWQGVFAQSGSTEKVKTLTFAPKRDGETPSYEFVAWLKPNSKIAFFPQLIVDNAKLRSGGAEKYDGRGLAILSVEIEGPLYDSWPGQGHELLFGNLPVREEEPANERMKKQSWYRPKFELVSQNPKDDANCLLRTFLPVAFRRPVSDADVAPLFELVNSELSQGHPFEEAMRTGYIAALCSPDFLYLKEPIGQLDDHAIASRLSYAFWKTMPDQELSRLAEDGNLSKPDQLRIQVDRLLDDPQSSRFVKAFTGQWLNLRDIDFTVPDKQLYPEYDDALKDAMIAETEGFFSEVLKSNLSLLHFIDSDWTMLNERLAKHYRISGIEGSDMRRVSLRPEHHRGGILTHASVLKVSANGTTTSPVVRGVFVLERILGGETPPPPPGIPGVEPDIRGATTLREQLTKHRDLESCNNCHKIIDPPGFAMENYDVMGGWRENYRSLNRDFPAPPSEWTGELRNIRWRVGPAVDASGKTPEGKKFSDLVEYKKALLATPEVFTQTLVKNVAVYVTGRAMGFSDRPELHRISLAVAAKGYGFRDLIHEITQSKLFRNK